MVETDFYFIYLFMFLGFTKHSTLLTSKQIHFKVDAGRLDWYSITRYIDKFGYISIPKLES